MKTLHQNTVAGFLRKSSIISIFYIQFLNFIKFYLYLYKIKTRGYVEHRR